MRKKLFPIRFRAPAVKPSFPFFSSIIEECLKIYYGNKDDAYERAVKEENQCYARSKSRLGTYFF